MSIYNVLSIEIPIIAYSVLHQHKSAITPKEHAKSLSNLRTALQRETQRIKAVWGSHIGEMTEKMVQASRGNLSQFLSTPLQSDTGEIQKIIKEQVLQTSEQLLPNILYGLADGYDAKYVLDANQNEIPRQQLQKGKSYLQNAGLSISKSHSSVYESLYIVQGGSNLDILENMVRNGITIYNSVHEKKVSEFETMVYSLQNLLYSDGNYNSLFDKFELQVNFVKGKEPYDLFHKELGESIKYFRTEIHHLNVSIWQRKLGLGISEEYTLRILTKDRFTLRSAIVVTQKFAKDKNPVANAVRSGSWLIKEII